MDNVYSPMKDREKLFGEFRPQSIESWRQRAEKDLRGKPLSELIWPIEDQISMEPYYTFDSAEGADREEPVRTKADWEIGEFIQVREVEAAVAALREAKQGGVEAPLLVLYHHLSKDQLWALLEEVDLPAQSLHITERYSEKEPDVLLEQVNRYLQDKEIDPASVSLSVDFDPLLDWNDPPFGRLQRSLQLCRDHLTRSRALQINGLHFHAGTEYTSRELATIIAKGSTYLFELKKIGVEPLSWLPHAQFNLAISTSFFLDIAKLRALRILWGNVLAAYGVQDAPAPSLVGHLSRDSQVEDTHQNMIRAGSQAMAAVLGGVDRLYLRPADFYQNDSSTAFTRRISRNVQHLLRLESQLGRVADPAAGSYYLEALTDKLCAEAWVQFQQIEAEGGF